MTPLLVLAALTFFPFVGGVIASAFIRGVPQRGWIALLLLVFAALLWTLSEPADTGARERVWTLPLFAFIAPAAIIYAFRIRRRAPDRIFVTAALVGACVVAVALGFLLCGAAYGVYQVLSHG